jgi:hypothetical protein
VSAICSTAPPPSRSRYFHPITVRGLTCHRLYCNFSAKEGADRQAYSSAHPRRKQCGEVSPPEELHRARSSPCSENFLCGCLEIYPGYGTPLFIVNKFEKLHYVISPCLPIDMCSLKRLLNEDADDNPSQGFHEQEVLQNEKYRSYPAQR